MEASDDLDLQAIYSQFKETKKSIENRVSEAKNIQELNEARLSVQKLNSSFSKNQSNLLQVIPAYDQKYYSESINALIELIDSKKTEVTSGNGVKKFSFKKRSLNSSNSTAQAEVISGSDAFSNPVITEPYERNIVDRTYIVPDSAPKYLYIDGVENSTVRTPEEATPYSIHISNLKNSKIQVSSKSSAFIENATDCQIVTRSLQLRLHKVIASTIVPTILNEENRIVIEDCSELKVGRVGQATFVEVDDFKLPSKSINNPHYDFLEDDDAVYEDMKDLLN